jgi:YVTN family beta-propeller protein
LAPANLALSPDGSPLFVLHQDGGLSVVEANPSRLTVVSEDTVLVRFHRPLAVLTPAQTSLSAPGSMALTPNEKVLYVVDDAQNRLAVFDFDAANDTLLTAGHVTDATDGVLLAPSDVAVTPDGRRAVIASRDNGIVYEASTTTHTTLSRLTNIASPDRILVHPLANRAYVTDGTTVRVLDIDPDSPGYQSVIASIAVAGVADSVRLVGTPDGGRVFAYSKLPASSSYEASVIATDSTAAGYHTVIGTVSLSTGSSTPTLVVNRSGTLLFVTDPNASAQRVYDLSTAVPDTIAGKVITDADLSGTRAMVTSFDDARLYATGAGDSLLVANLTPTTNFTYQSGTGQIGVVNRPLSAPIVARVTGSPQQQVEGSLVTFDVDVAGAGFGFPDGKLYVAADAQGLVRARFHSGPTATVVQITATVGGSTYPTSVTVVPDTTLTAPLIVATQPSDGATEGVDTSVGVDFSKSVNPATLNANSLRLKPAAGGDPVPAYLTVARRKRRVVVTPSSPLAFNTQYTFEISIGDTIRDFSGNPVDPTSIQFGTVAPPPSVKLRSVSPSYSAPGSPLVLEGRKFSPIPSENKIHFGSTEALVAQAHHRVLKTALPVGVPPGSLSVFVTVGADTSEALPFKVLEPPPPSPSMAVSQNVTVPSSGQQIVLLPDRRAYITYPSANAVLPLRFRLHQTEPPIPVGIQPFALTVTPRGDRIYVSNFFSNNVSVIDTDPSSPTFQQVIASIPTGENPTGIAIHPDGRSLYVASLADTMLTVLDTDSTHATYHTARSATNTGSTAKSVVITPDGGRVIVGTSQGLLVVDPGTGAAIDQYDLGSATQSIAVLPSGGFALVLTEGGILKLIDLRPGQSGAARAATNTGSTSKSVVITPDGGFALITSDVGRIFIKKIRLLPGGGGAADAGSAQYGLDDAGEVVVGENPFGMCFDPLDPTTLLVVNAGSGTVSELIVDTATTAPDAISLLPVRFALYANYPNPFRRGTTIRYDVPKLTTVDLRIYNVMGRLVRDLENETMREPGRYSVVWDGRDRGGLRVASGIYFYQFRAADFRQSRKLVVVR